MQMLIAGIIIAVIFVIVIIGVAVKLSSGSSTKTMRGDYYDREDFVRFKGEVGENIVAQVLGDTVIGEKYVINNIIFADRQGRSCQIDYIYINKHGIWVIETKNYSGRIYGADEWREWTQVLAYGNEKHKLYNPVKQNATHIYMLSKQIRERNVFLNLVVFLRGADITNVQSESVCGIDYLQQVINEDTGLTLSPLQMERYYKRLRALKDNNTLGVNEHVNNIKIMQDNINRGICPRCGANLVLRNSKNGQFYGCEKYPKCKFTKNL